VGDPHAADFTDRLDDLRLGEGTDQQFLKGVLNADHLRSGRGTVVDRIEPVVGAQVAGAGPLVVGDLDLAGARSPLDLDAEPLAGRAGARRGADRLEANSGVWTKRTLLPVASSKARTKSMAICSMSV